MHRNLAVLAAALLTVTACAGDDDDTAAAARDVAIRATDSLRFDPSEVTARAGERVTFVISNTGTVDHEFVLGSATYLSDHAEAADEASGDAHAGHGGGTDGVMVEVAAGKTARVTFTMPDDAPTFACFVDRHDKAGMTGTVSYA